MTDSREKMAENPVSAVEVLGVLTGQVPVRSMPVATPVDVSTEEDDPDDNDGS
jgi:hypothetical protein